MSLSRTRVKMTGAVPAEIPPKGYHAYSQHYERTVECVIIWSTSNTGDERTGGNSENIQIGWNRRIATANAWHLLLDSSGATTAAEFNYYSRISSSHQK